MKRIMEILQHEVNEPTLYGWFHLMWLGIIIALGVFLIVKYRNSSEKTFKKIWLWNPNWNQ